MKINLKLWMFLKIIPYVELLLFYCALISNTAYLKAITCFPLVFIITIILLLFIRKRREIVDEFAFSLLKKVDAFCLKIAFVIMAMMLPATIIGGDISGYIMGIMVSGGMVTLALVRAFAFLVFDMKGM